MTAQQTSVVPRVGWLVSSSLWLLPVLFGFGLTSWIGFGLIGLLVVRVRWVLLAVAWLIALTWLGFGPVEVVPFAQRIASGYLDPTTDIVLLVLYLAGAAYGMHANRVWLRILWGRRERGVRMLGWAPPAAVAPAIAAPARDERDELLTRFAGDARALLIREQLRMRQLLHAAVAARAAPATSEVVPSTTLPASTLLVHTTLLGLPSGPVDVRVASVDEIAAIPGIGPARAAQLVAARDTHPLASVDDVVTLLGLTAVDLVRARSYLRF